MLCFICLFVCFKFWAKPGCAQGSLLLELREPYGMLVILNPDRLHARETTSSLSTCSGPWKHFISPFPSTQNLNVKELTLKKETS